MLIGKYSSLKTFELFEHYAAWCEEYENVVRTKKKLLYTSARFRKWKEQRIDELDLVAAAIEAEITGRYKGLTKLICLWAGVTDGQQYAAVIKAVWDSVRDKWSVDMACIPRDYREFPRWFWGAFERNLSGDISPLKAKFMLRPFVDDLPCQPERDALLTRVYNDRTKPPTDKQTFDNLLEPACRLLHQRLLQQAAHIGVLTDEVMSRETLESVASPFEFYVGLLFPKRVRPEEGA